MVTNDNTTAPVFFGATFLTEKHNFGQVTSVFEVSQDWDGHRFTGYKRMTAAEAAAWFEADLKARGY